MSALVPCYPFRSSVHEHRRFRKLESFRSLADGEWDSGDRNLSLHDMLRNGVEFDVSRTRTLDNALGTRLDSLQKTDSLFPQEFGVEATPVAPEQYLLEKFPPFETNVGGLAGHLRVITSISQTAVDWWQPATSFQDWRFGPLAAVKRATSSESIPDPGSSIGGTIGVSVSYSMGLTLKEGFWVQVLSQAYYESSPHGFVVSIGTRSYPLEIPPGDGWLNGFFGTRAVAWGRDKVWISYDGNIKLVHTPKVRQIWMTFLSTDQPGLFILTEDGTLIYYYLDQWTGVLTERDVDGGVLCITKLDTIIVSGPYGPQGADAVFYLKPGSAGPEEHIKTFMSIIY